MKRQLPFSLAAGRQVSSTSLVEASDTPISPFVLPSESSSPSTKRSFLIYSSPADIEARRQKQQASTLKIDLERLSSQLVTERAKFEQACSSRDARILELEKDRKFLCENEKSLCEELEKIKRDASQQVGDLKRSLASARSESESLTEQLQEVMKEKRLLSRNITILESQVKSMEFRMNSEIERLQQGLIVKDSTIQSKDSLISELHQSLEGRVRNSTSAPSPPEVVMPSHSELLDRLHSFEVDNRRLQYENRVLSESAQSSKLLAERLHTAEQRLEMYRDLERQFNEMKASQQISAPISEERNPSTSTRTIRELLERTAEFARLQSEFGQLDAEYKLAFGELKVLKERLSKTEQNLVQLNEENSSLKSKLLLANGQDSILRSEIELLKGRLEAAEKLEKANQAFLLNISKKHKPSQTEIVKE